jgi:hypothetical protein
VHRISQAPLDTTATRDALMSSHTGIDKEKKRTQNEKFDETTKLLHDVKVNDNASLNENMNHIFVGTSFNHPK